MGLVELLGYGSLGMVWVVVMGFGINPWRYVWQRLEVSPFLLEGSYKRKKMKKREGVCIHDPAR
jgi:hypothetical protein